MQTTRTTSSPHVRTKGAIGWSCPARGEFIGGVMTEWKAWREPGEVERVIPCTGGVPARAMGMGEWPVVVAALLLLLPPPFWSELGYEYA